MCPRLCVRATHPVASGDVSTLVRASDLPRNAYVWAQGNLAEFWLLTFVPSLLTASCKPAQTAVQCTQSLCMANILWNAHVLRCEQYVSEIRNEFGFWIGRFVLIYIRTADLFETDVTPMTVRDLMGEIGEIRFAIGDVFHEM